jgi:hypothetical protein
VRPAISCIVIKVALALGATACAKGASSPAPPQDAPAIGTPVAPSDSAHAEVRPEQPIEHVTVALTGLARRALPTCGSAVFVWGDIASVPQARPARVALTGASTPPLAGWLLCDRDLPELLAAQKSSARLKGARSGGGDLRWADGQLLLRRAWTGSADAPLGDLSSPPDALQKGELLAVAFDSTSSDASATAGAVLPALVRLPRYFLLGMWTVPAR